jgi:hypothetical protein
MRRLEMIREDKSCLRGNSQLICCTEQDQDALHRALTRITMKCDSHRGRSKIQVSTERWPDFPSLSTPRHSAEIPTACLREPARSDERFGSRMLVSIHDQLIKSESLCTVSTLRLERACQLSRPCDSKYRVGRVACLKKPCILMPHVCYLCLLP